MRKAGALLLAMTLMCGACGAEKAAVVRAPAAKIEESREAPPVPRIDPSFVPLVRWIPNETGALLLIARGGSLLAVDRLIEPLLMEMPDALASMMSGVRGIRLAYELVGGAFEGPMFVRAEHGGDFSKKSAIGHRAGGVASLLEQATESVNGFRMKPNTTVNVETWSTLLLSDTDVALVPPENLNAFTSALVKKNAGDPVALRGRKVHAEAGLLAMAWYVPGPLDRDARPIRGATARLVEGASGSLTFTLVLEPKVGSDPKAFAEALEGLKTFTSGALRESYRAANVRIENDASGPTVVFEVTFTADVAASVGRAR